ncbi:Peroxin-3 [Sphaerosporella brunnea]|uniref:Peroxin-3 n=1 Tax=Sphaerosporella brunnea TaxID=1250544 RepID=A0A5J5F4M8_9PEZI|nr:Peroxin-3 [Sphaerosporella brunnea]
MFMSTRNFFKRNRRNLAVGFGLLSAGYLAVQYMGNKISEARSRLMTERVAKENINRRFQQNQEDCTYTVSALLPTATENIVKELPVEALTQELQQKKAARIAKSSGASDAGGTVTLPTASVVSLREDDTQSLQSFASETFSTVLPPPTAEEKRKPRKTKLQLWDEIKIYSITRSFTLLYTLSLLTLLTRVQLNLLGRKNYLSSVLTLASGRNDADPTIRLEEETTAGTDDLETNRAYLTFSWWLLHRGWRLLNARVEAATKSVFGALTPRDTITLGRFRSLAMEVRRQVEAPESGEIAWLQFLLPPREQEENVLRESGVAIPSPPPQELRWLLDETSDLLESPMAAQVLAHMLAVGFEMLIDGKLAPATFPHSAAASTAEAAAAEESDASSIYPPKPRLAPRVDDDAPAKFASVLAFLAKQAPVIGGTSLAAAGGNEYLVAMEKGTELEGFSALVYTSNFESVAAAQAELSS